MFDLKEIIGLPGISSKEILEVISKDTRTLSFIRAKLVEKYIAPKIFSKIGLSVVEYVGDYRFHYDYICKKNSTIYYIDVKFKNRKKIPIKFSISDSKFENLHKLLKKGIVGYLIVFSDLSFIFAQLQPKIDDLITVDPQTPLVTFGNIPNYLKELEGNLSFRIVYYYPVSILKDILQVNDIEPFRLNDEFIDHWNSAHKLKKLE